MEKLKPCPFCGGDVEAERIAGNCQLTSKTLWSVWCQSCNMAYGFDPDYGGSYTSKEKAVAAWNHGVEMMRKNFITYKEPEVTVIKDETVFEPSRQFEQGIIVPRMKQEPVSELPPKYIEQVKAYFESRGMPCPPLEKWFTIKGPS